MCIVKRTYLCILVTRIGMLELECTGKWDCQTEIGLGTGRPWKAESRSEPEGPAPTATLRAPWFEYGK